jgi:predicted ATPase/class 3 adenylate cyclase
MAAVASPDTGAVAPPTGTVTFWFTDIEGSTRLWDEHPESMRAALADHDAIVRGAIEGHGGYVFATGGDGFAAAFQRVGDALRAAVSAQGSLEGVAWPSGAVLRVRMGLHTGEAEERQGDYLGSAVNRAARLMSLAHGGQIVVSEATADVAADSLPEGVSLVGLGEHVLRDLSRREHVYQVTAAGLAREFAPLRSPDVLLGNLPLQPTSFVGREDDVRAVCKALADARLVTLIGVGGVGKTRLALQVAAELVPSFPDGVWLCELAAAEDPDTMAQVVASTLGASPRAGRSLAQSIVEFLAPSELLVVLDNCEHLLDAAGGLAAAVLAHCPGVRVLATSREALAVPGEQIWPLRSLLVPAPDDAVEVAAAAGAVRLFCERAGAARPGFELSGANEAAVVEVCRRLDGIPLAIELAAARVAAMTAAEIAGLLDERFRLLTGGRRTAVERHQTLRATVDWSYSLLSASERVVFERLSVFSGGFSLDGARTVVAAEGVAAWDVLDAVGALVAKSMVVAEATGGDVTRYQLLETLRQYGRERLEDKGETDRWRRRHAGYFADYAMQLWGGLRGPDELAWRERLMTDLDNLRAAVVWSLDSGRVEDAEAAVRIVAWLTYQSFYPSTGIGGWAEQAIEAAQRSSPGLRQAVLAGAAHGAELRGDIRAMRHYATAGVEEGYPPDCPEPYQAFAMLSVSLVSAGRRDEAAACLDAAEAALASRADDVTLCQLQHQPVMLSLYADDEDEEIARARRAVAMAERIANPTLLASTSYALGWALRHRHPGEALVAFDGVPALAVSVNVAPLAWAFGARIAAAQGDAQGAKARLRQGLEACIRADAWIYMTGCLDSGVDTLCRLGASREAAVLAGAVDTAFAPIRFPHVGSAGRALEVRTENLARARGELGDAQYERAYAEGAAMSREQTVAFVLNLL